MPVSDNIAWPAPGKLNLFLHVTGRRADGYHLLQTVFQFIDRCDWLYFESRRDGAIRRGTDLDEISPEHDLALRAARLLREETGVGWGVDIRIDKRLPIGGGLGGGSSDAATTLLALNRLWALDLPVARLAGLGLRLGADVPVFVQGHAAWAEGVGERLTPISLDEPWYVVLVPPVRVSTAEVFGAPELTRNADPIKINDFLSGRCVNTCESVVCARYPAVAEALHWLSRWGAARVTGTGACVYAAFPDEAHARSVLARVPQPLQGFVARGLNRSPVLARLAQER